MHQLMTGYPTAIRCGKKGGNIRPLRINISILKHNFQQKNHELLESLFDSFIGCETKVGGKDYKWETGHS